MSFNRRERPVELVLLLPLCRNYINRLLGFQRERECG